MPHCDTLGATSVLGYSRVIYPGIFPRIDMHFYSGSMGQKMAFVLEPGCDPEDLKLAFEGQDSISVDLFGGLKLYLDGNWMVIPFVQAYQVDNNGTVVPVSWVANYQVDNGVGVVGFTWSNYNAAWPLVFQIGIPPLGPQDYDEEGLCWSTYMGGDGFDIVTESTQDEEDNYYVAGYTFSTFMSFPEAPGTNYSSDSQTAAFVMQLDAGDDINWKTFFGGGPAEQTYPTGLFSKFGSMLNTVGS